MLHCPHGYAEYRAARDKVYAARAAAAEVSWNATAGRRKSSTKKARMEHGHKREKILGGAGTPSGRDWHKPI